MFFLIRLLWLVIVFAPLVLTAIKNGRGALENPRRALIRSGVWAGVTLIIMFAVDLGVYLFIEHSWFSQLAASNRFWTEYVARLALGIGGGVVAFGIAALVLLRLRGKLGGNTGVAGPLVVSGIIAVIAGLALSNMWEQVLVFFNRVGGLPGDPGIGVTRSFYLFALPLLYRLLALAENVVFLLLLGSVYVALADQQFQALTTSDLSRLFPSIKAGHNTFRGLAAAFLLKVAAQRVLNVFELPLQREGVVFGAGWMDVNVHLPTLIVAAAVFASAAVWILFVGRMSGTGGALQVAGGAGSNRGTGSDRGAGGAGSSGGGGGNVPATTNSNGSGTTDRNLPTTAGAGSGSGGQPPQDFGGWWRRHKRAALVPIILVGTLVVARGLVPAIIRPLVLKPNEITLEKPYLQHNIDLTRQAYGISDATVTTERYQVGREVTPALADSNRSTLDNIRLWDPGALLDNLREQQEIRLYYQFHDVDIDRYHLQEGYTQLMLSVRELEQSALASESDTWVSRHLKYTHGYGVVALPVQTVRPDGRPELLVKNIPPESDAPRLNVTQPRIYYGERTSNHVYVGTSQEEFDYPAGDTNRYSNYDGSGGVPIGGLLRRIVYASRFDGAQQLFSSYIQPESRILFRRTLQERVQELAPFLEYDEDPYPVIDGQGRVKYIMDAYTVATTYPYAERYVGKIGRFRGANYIRNSVKVVIDAYDGTVDFYTIDEEDPVLRTYRSVFPGLFQPISAMDETLRSHIRYPIDMMTIQAEMYRTYHMTQPELFYQREDLWEFATERYREDFQPVEPYYALINLPDQEGAEFVGMLPFTPSNKNVINAWMAARSDAPNYGELQVFTFPKGVEVLGPRQIEARIDQNTEMSRSLSLWGQRGSEVIRGNLLAIPLFDEEQLVILYAEPIFLQAENANLPEIKRIALADQSDVVWAPTFEEVLQMITGQKPAELPGADATATSDAAEEETDQPESTAEAYGTTGSPGPDGGAGRTAATGAAAADSNTGQTGASAQEQRQFTPEQLSRARDAYDRFKEAVQNDNFQDAGAALEELGAVLGVESTE